MSIENCYNGPMEKAVHPSNERERTRFGELSAAELKLITACREGELATIAESRPNTEQPENRVRAGLVRFLALGGDDNTLVHETGVQLRGACLVGLLNLDHVSITRPIVLADCLIEQIDARHARLRTLNLQGSKLIKGINGDGLRSEGPIFMRAGFEAGASVRLITAQIGVDLDCSSGRFDGGKGTALLLDGATIFGSFRLDDARALGEVRLVRAEIKGGLECHGTLLENPQGDALACQRAKISSVCLREGFHATGAVGFEGAQVFQDVNCAGGSFDHGAESTSRNSDAHGELRSGIALSFSGARIDGALKLKDVVRINGILDLSDLKAGRLTDDEEGWFASRGELLLDGFVYGRFADAPADAASRIEWLGGQNAEHLGKQFRSQPWEQLISVLRATGHREDARIVAMEKQKRLRRAGKLVRGLRHAHWLYGAMAGYGYRPTRLLFMIACVWLICAAAYGLGYNQDPAYIEPWPRSDKASDKAVAVTRGPLDPLIYSADVLLPVVDFGHAADWRIVVTSPDGSPLIWGKALRILFWMEIAFGWLASVLLASAAGTLIKKD